MRPIISEPRTQTLRARPHKTDGNTSISNRYRTLQDHVESYTMRTYIIILSSFLLGQNNSLISHNFLIKTYQLLHTSFLHPVRNLVQVCTLAKRLGHFEFKTLWSLTVVHLLSAAVPQETYPHAMPEALVFCCCHQFEREESRKFCFPQILLVPRADSSIVQQKVRSSA